MYATINVNLTGCAYVEKIAILLINTNVIRNILHSISSNMKSA